MISPKRLLKSVARRFGYDMVAYRPFLELLEEWGMTTVFDVGANEGQFAEELRQSGFKGQIHSFEPTKTAFSKLAARCEGNCLWRAEQIGFGTSDEVREIAIAENSQLTSVLSPIRNHAIAGSESIQLRRLDSWLASKHVDLSVACLKLDVQGYEREILLGAGEAISSFGAIIVELAICPSYQNQPYAEDLIAFLRSQGFDLWVTRRGTWTPHGHREMECDELFRNAQL